MTYERIFREAAGRRIVALEAALESLDAGSDEAADSLRRLAHSLRGSGASYGFPEVTEAAALVEDAAPDALAQAARDLLDVLRGVAVATPERSDVVLVVDDDPLQSHLARGTLEAPGRQVLSAASWAEARAMLAEHDVALILLDLVLPDADGRNVLLTLREDARTAATPIFVVSGKVGPLPRSECLALGADRFFEKPYDLEALRSAVADGVRARPTGRAAARFDARTGLLNRAAFRESFERAVAPSSAAAGARLSLALVTMVVGDASELLRRVADALCDALGPRAVVARWSDDTLAVLAPGLGEAEARATIASALEGMGGARLLSAGVAAVAPSSELAEAADRAEAARLTARAGGRVAAAESEGSAATRARRVLLADDDPLIVSLVRHRLERDGSQVVHCESGREALDVARGETFDCIILDVKLPELDGFTVLEELRREPRLAGTPIVMLTAMGEERDVVRGLGLGADDYVIKPFSPVELAARLQRLANRRVAESRREELSR